MARLLLGIDLGWNKHRRICALAMRGPTSLRNAHQFEPNLSVGVYAFNDLLNELGHLANCQKEFRTATVVINGPVGPKIDAVINRWVDTSFPRSGFYRRVPDCTVISKSGKRLSNDAATILHMLAKVVPVRPWFGGSLPSDGLLVAETNSIAAMALLSPQQSIASLPLQVGPKSINGRQLPAKADWYWQLGARRYTANVLGIPQIETHPTRDHVGALFNLAMAAGLVGEAQGETVAALGGHKGIHLIPSDVDVTWKNDVERIGIAFGQVTFADRSALTRARSPLRTRRIGRSS